MQKGYKAHLSALKSGKQYKRPSVSSSIKTGSKRKRSEGGRGGSPKRHKGDASSDGSDSNSDDDEYDDGESDSEENSASDDDIEADSDASEGSDDDSTQSSVTGSGNEEDEDEELSVDDLKERINECQVAIKTGLKNQKEAKKEHAEALEAFNKAKRDKAMAQKNKNAFCSLKRSAYSEGVLKNDFRAGLKEIDDAAEEERDSYAFDPAIDIRGMLLDSTDPSKTDRLFRLCCYRPTGVHHLFKRLCSYQRPGGRRWRPHLFLRRYGYWHSVGVRQTFLAKEMFSFLRSALQDWCHSLTVTSRERSARSFFNQFRTFLDNVSGC
jgi:hypothetical protein